jgi:uncharacterized protein (DUF2267 family)
LPADEVVYLGQQLPPLVRGLYYEGWHFGRRATPLRNRNAFLERIHDGVHRDPAIDAEQVRGRCARFGQIERPAGALLR